MRSAKCEWCVHRAAWVSTLGNALVAAVKWYVGLACHSQAVVADALHSTMDVTGSLAGVVSIRLARRGASRRYPYGLGRLEDITASAIYIVLITAGTTICVNAIRTIAAGDLMVPKLPAMVVMVTSISANALMYFFIYCAGQQANSPSLIALACENRADSMSSVAALLGVAGAIMGVPLLDPLAALTVGVVIVVGNVRGLHQAASRLTDAALPRAVRHEIERAAASVPYVQGVLAIRSRMLGFVPHADIDILVDPDISIEAAQDVADSVTERVRMNVTKMGVVRVYAHPTRGTHNHREARLIELCTAMSELRAQPKRNLP